MDPIVRPLDLEPREVLGLLLEGDRLRAVARLTTAGLLLELDGRYRLNVEGLRDVVRAGARKPAPDEPDERHPDDARVLRAFFRGGRLVSIPAQRVKRLVVLDRLAGEFEPGARYPERVVNALLNRFHADHASLRRYLVEEGFLRREGGEYWRAGGTFDVDA